MQGNFINIKLRFKDLNVKDNYLKDYQILSVNFLSGMDNFKGDGSLGFG